MPGITGVEAAKGLLEKLPAFVSLPILTRVLAPGALSTAVIYPFTGITAPGLKMAESSLLTEYLPILLFGLGWLVSSLVLGAFASIVLGGEIYKVYEGRILWPGFAWRLATGFQNSRVKKLRDKANDASRKGNTVRYNELWFRLRRYPINQERERCATHPTLLGNILAEYEDYPDTRYRMDAVFYWPRLWLALDKDKKDEIDSSWSVADGLLVLSAVSIVGGVVWMAVAAFRHLGHAFAEPGGLVAEATRHPIHLPFDSSSTTAAVGGALLILGYVWYRLSLPFHRQNGEVFKSMFDLYRDKLAPMTRLDSLEGAIWDGTWLYLQYLLIRCMRCDATYAANLERCDNCFLPRWQSLQMLRRQTDPPASTR